MELGSGGMAVVHLAMSRGPQGFVKLFVLKMLKRELLGDDGSRRMFLEEARISARLAHPNIVQVYEVTEIDGVPTIVMEYLEGQPLSAILSRRDAPLPLPMHLHVITKLLCGLHAAHELRDYDGTPLNLVHRDVSPHNVFVLYDGQVKVLDFGIAKAANSEVQTRTGVMKGKIRYMAPEQLAGEEQDRRADVFAAGVMLWEALAGKRLWGEMADGEVMLHLLSQKIPELPEGAAISPELRRVCRQALSAHRDGRQQSALELMNELESELRDELRCSSDQVAGHLRQEFANEREHTQRLIDGALKAAEKASQRPPPAGNDNDLITTRPPSVVPKARLRWAPLAAIALVSALAVAVWFALTSPAQTEPAVTGSGVAASATADGPLACGASSKACGEQCVSKDRPDYGCGDASCLPCATSNATPRCNASGQCDIAVCYQGFDNCDGNPANGCEVNVRTTPDHCGACGRRCPELPHAERGCGDVCTIWRCKSGFRDCNGQSEDGCEIETTSNPKHCGHCGVVCARGQRCEAGRCAG